MAYTKGDSGGVVQQLAQAKIKFFGALQRKKDRHAHRLFLAEGKKMAMEAIASAPTRIEAVIGTAAFWAEADGGQALLAAHSNLPMFSCTEASLSKLTDQSAPEGVVAVMHMPQPAPLTPPTNAALVLAGVQDPGNLGTIIRTADWFGFKTIYCAPGTADAYNPKVVRATMGAIFRVHLQQVDDLQGFLTPLATRLVIAAMHGVPLKQAMLAKRDVLLLGSETHGVPAELVQLPGVFAVTIERSPGSRAESLNVATAAGILCHAMTQGN